MVYFMLFRGRNRDLDFWFPSERVKTEILEKNITYSLPLCQLNCFGLDTASMKTTVLSCEVTFSESEVKSEPKTYLLEKKTENSLIFLTFEVSEEKSVLKGLSSESITCNCSD